MEEIDKLNIPIDELINVEMTKDRMMGVISFCEPANGGRVLRYEEILSAIKFKGIVAGLKEADIREIALNKQYNHKYIIAQGVPAQNGKDAKVELKFNPIDLNNLAPKEYDDGSVDFKDLDSIRNVKKGEVLATKVLATEGIDGFNVLGQKLTAKRGKDVRLPKGKNTEITEDGCALIASQDGKLEYDDEKVVVRTVCVIAGDVDNSTGNIEFIGSIVINGTVHDGFTVKARGSVEVRGPVEGATIIAGGDIILSYGVQGSEKSRLEAGGNIVAKFIQNANIKADGDIITEGIWNSKVIAGGVIKVDVGKGSIVGGNIAATNIILARNVGSSLGAVTGLQTGVQPYVYTEYEELRAAIQKETDELSDIEKEILFIKTRNAGVPLDHFKEKRLQRLIRQRQALMEQLQCDKKRYARLHRTLDEATDGVIKVSGKVYPGVKMVLGSTTTYIDRVQTACTFKKDGADITVGAYKEESEQDKRLFKDSLEGICVEEYGRIKYRKK